MSSFISRASDYVFNALYERADLPTDGWPKIEYSENAHIPNTEDYTLLQKENIYYYLKRDSLTESLVKSTVFKIIAVFFNVLHHLLSVVTCRFITTRHNPKTIWYDNSLATYIVPLKTIHNL